MDDELKAKLMLKEVLHLPYPIDSMLRAPEYEALKGGGTMCFRVGGGKVYEITPGGHSVFCYDEDDLNQLLILEKYNRKTMLKNEVMELINNPSIQELFHMAGDVSDKMRGVFATLEATGYDEVWIKDMLEPEFRAAFIDK